MRSLPLPLYFPYVSRQCLGGQIWFTGSKSPSGRSVSGLLKKDRVRVFFFAFVGHRASDRTKFASATRAPQNGVLRYLIRRAGTF